VFSPTAKYLYDIPKEDFRNEERWVTNAGLTRKGLCRAREVETCYDSTTNATKEKDFYDILRIPFK